MSHRTSRDLADVFARFGPAFMHWMKRGMRDQGLSFARMRLLWSLDTEGSLIMSELGEELGVTARSVTSLVDGLEQEGYVRRTAHPEDRRATLIELTEAGQEAIARLHADHQKRAAVLFDELSPRDRQALLRIMGELVGTLRELETPEVDAR